MAPGQERSSVQGLASAWLALRLRGTNLLVAWQDGALSPSLGVWAWEGQKSGDS